MTYVKVCRGGELRICDNTSSKIIPMGSDLVFRALNKKIVIDSDFTLQDYFEMFLKYPFLQHLEDFLKNFIDRYKDEKDQGFPSKNIEDDDGWIDLTHIVVSKETHVVKTEPTEAESYIRVDGKGMYLQDDENDQYKKGDICESCGIELTDFITMLDCRIELKVPSVTVSEDRYNYCSDTYLESVSDCDSGYTLFEFVTSIIWELSFFGCPCSIDERAQEFQDTVERIETGEEELIEVTNINDLFNESDMNNYEKREHMKRIDWLKKQIENAIKDKKYWDHKPEVLDKIDNYIKAKESEIKEVERLLTNICLKEIQ